MFSQRRRKAGLLGLFLLSLLMLASRHQHLLSAAASAAGNWDSERAAGAISAYPEPPTPTPGDPILPPFPTPSVEPTVTPGPSTEGQIALQYIAEQEGIPIVNLRITNEHVRRYPMLNRKFAAIAIIDLQSRRAFRVLVDLANGAVEPDIAAVERAEVSAQDAKYGKLHPALYERLQIAGDEELLPVAIWVKGGGRSDEQLYTILASRYPAVRGALARHASPFDLDDPELVRRIQNEFQQMRQEDIEARLKPLLDDLNRRGIIFQTYFLLPSITTKLPKVVILELATRDEIETIYLADRVEQPKLGSASSTDRAPSVWAKGINGSGITIGILEHGNVDRDNSYLQHANTWRNSDVGEKDHTTRVASSAASFHSTYRGTAPGAVILSAGENGTESDIVAGLNWALDNGAHVVNFSAGTYDNSRELQWLDRAFDGISRNRQATIVVASGDFVDQIIDAPAKAWNVITVGGTNDQENSLWADDVMFRIPDTNLGSAFEDPGYTDREKPEVVAPAQEITALGIGTSGQPNTAGTASGTSFSAPQVAGVIALLMQRNVNIRALPTAIKAILMASAVHNIEGYRYLSDQDGAGSIDADLADTIVQLKQTHNVACDRPCWWSVQTTDTWPGPNGAFYENFTAQAGERIRVAIAWFSKTDASYSRDWLNSKYNLYVWSPSGNLMWASVTQDNNYEIADFTADRTGTYLIEIRDETYSSIDTANVVGIAWTKDATYLPDLRNRQDDWLSYLYVRNDGAEHRDVRIRYFQASGTTTISDVCSLAPNQRCWIPLDDANKIPTGTSGSAVVDGAADVSVVVVQTRSGPYANGAHLGIGQPDKEIHIPLLHKNNSGWYSQIRIQNTATTNSNVTIAFKHSTGSSCSVSYTVSAGSVLTVNLANISCIGSTFIGSARITANQPLAVVSVQSTTNSFMETNHTRESQNITYTPLIQNNNSGWVSGLVIQNTSTTANTLDTRYYTLTGTQCASASYSNIAAYYPKVVNPVPPAGGSCGSIISGKFAGLSGPLAATLNQLLPNSSHAGAYSAIRSPSQSAVVPLFWKQISGWSSGLVVQNVNDESVSLIIYYYNSDGTENTGARYSGTLNARATGIYNGVPANVSTFAGSVAVVASKPVAVSVNHYQNGAGGDAFMSQEAVHR